MLPYSSALAKRTRHDISLLLLFTTTLYYQTWHRSHSVYVYIPLCIYYFVYVYRPLCIRHSVYVYIPLCIYYFVYVCISTLYTPLCIRMYTPRDLEVPVVIWGCLGQIVKGQFRTNVFVPQLRESERVCVYERERERERECVCVCVWVRVCVRERERQTDRQRDRKRDLAQHQLMWVCVYVWYVCTYTNSTCA